MSCLLVLSQRTVTKRLSTVDHILNELEAVVGDLVVSARSGGGEKTAQEHTTSEVVIRHIDIVNKYGRKPIPVTETPSPCKEY